MQQHMIEHTEECFRVNKKMTCELDHLVIGAETLDQGCDFIGD